MKPFNKMIFKRFKMSVQWCCSEEERHVFLDLPAANTVSVGEVRGLKCQFKIS